MKKVRNGFFVGDVEVRKHPSLPIFCAANGAVINLNSTHKPRFTYGGLHRNTGYRTIWIGRRPDRKHYRVHRLIAETFIPNPDNKPTVDHINRIRDDNRVENLRWATMSEQQDNTVNALEPRYGIRFCENPTEYRHRVWETLKNSPEYEQYKTRAKKYDSSRKRNVKGSPEWLEYKLKQKEYDRKRYLKNKQQETGCLTQTTSTSRSS